MEGAAGVPGVQSLKSSGRSITSLSPSNLKKMNVIQLLCQARDQRHFRCPIRRIYAQVNDVHMQSAEITNGADHNGQTGYNIDVITALKVPVLFSLVLFICIAAPAQQAENPKVSMINIVVVKEHGGAPVKNAEVVLHMLDKDGNEKQDGLELKTHEDGKAWTDGVPYGKVRIQVIARGFRTWGNDFDVKEPNMAVTVKLQKPKPQFSIYK